MKDGNKYTSDFNFFAQKYERIYIIFDLRIEKMLVILRVKKIYEYFLVFAQSIYQNESRKRISKH